jgi:pimeloyl-ACP methyl ester carboxylesterase
MTSISSSDGTEIAFDRTGDGPPVVLVGGAFSERTFPAMVQLASRLSARFTVFNYDRRGRGGSGDTGSATGSSVEREVDDLRAVVAAASGEVSVFGLSSGAVLALRAAAAGVPMSRLALYEPPFVVDEEGFLPPADLGARIDELLRQRRHGRAVTTYMKDGMGVPAAMVNLMPLFPGWRRLKRLAPTIPYDYAVMGEDFAGRPLRASDWSGVGVPTLVLSGERSPIGLRHGAEAIARVLPAARHLALAGQNHMMKPEVVAPVVLEHFTSDSLQASER